MKYADLSGNVHFSWCRLETIFWYKFPPEIKIISLSETFYPNQFEEVEQYILGRFDAKIQNSLFKVKFGTQTN